MGSPIDTAGPADPVAGKRELRRSMRVARREVDDPVGRARRIWDAVQGLPSVRSASVVMAFESIPGEPDTAPFIEWCASRGKAVVVPAPDPTAAFPADVDPIDVVVVPGVAFTIDGDRLGQGGGWYDRLLAAVGPECRSIGVCFAEQIVGSIPTEPHDRPVDLVVTDAGVHGTG